MRRIAIVIVMAAGLIAARSATKTATKTATKNAATHRASTVTVQMVGSSAGYKFDPANLTIKTGDVVKFVVASGGPHNVSFDASAIPAGAAAVLQKNMTGQQAPLMGPLLPNNGDSYTVSFAGAPTGTYHFFCLPHQSLNMTGIITVQ
jgi:plastocyanin